MTEARIWHVDLDGTDVEITALTGRIIYCGEEVSREKMQALQEAIHQARVVADLQRSELKRAAERRSNEEHYT